MSLLSSFLSTSTLWSTTKPQAEESDDQLEKATDYLTKEAVWAKENIPVSVLCLSHVTLANVPP